MRESRDAALNWQVYIIPGSPETRGHGTTGSQAKLDAQQLEMVPPLPGEEAMYAQFRWLMDVVGDDPDLKQAMVDEAVQTEEEVIDPFFEWQHNGKPAGNGWNRSVNNAEWELITTTAPARPSRTCSTTTFPAGQEPPVNGFWSLTLYNDNHFFHPNDLGRYSLGTTRPAPITPSVSATSTCRPSSRRRRRSRRRSEA